MSDVKRMAEILKAGATMLSEACPSCGSPLFRMPSGETYCASCNQKVILVKTDEEAIKLSSPLMLARLESTLTDKLQKAELEIRKENRTPQLQELINLTVSYLEVLDKIRKLRSSA